MLSLGMAQVCQEKETVAAETVKLAWEQVKEKVEIWKEAAAQMEKRDVRSLRDEERAEEGTPLVAKKNECNRRFLAQILILNTVIMWFSFLGIGWLEFGGNSKLDTLQGLLFMFAALAFCGQVFLKGALFRFCELNNLEIDVNLDQYEEDVRNRCLGRLSTLIYVCLLIVVASDQSREKSYFIAKIVVLSLSLTSQLIISVTSPMPVEINNTKSAEVERNTTRSSAQEMANTIDVAVTVTQNWAAIKSGHLQELLVADSQVNFKMILAASPNIEAVIQNCKKAQAICQDAVSNQDSSIATKQAMEILQAIATAEGDLLQVEQMLSQPHHLDIQVK
jgi:hypothetical protein